MDVQHARPVTSKLNSSWFDTLWILEVKTDTHESKHTSKSCLFPVVFPLPAGDPLVYSQHEHAPRKKRLFYGINIERRP